MPLNDLTDPAAVLSALDEFDQLGREVFLEKYGFGTSKTYFLKLNNKLYDSKAIVGVAHGYQFPELGQLRSRDFAGGYHQVQLLLEKLGFEVVVQQSGAPTISSEDIELIRQSKKHDRYTDFTELERKAHERVHNALRELGGIAVKTLGGSKDYVLKLTSGFHPASGIRGGKPKDLWFGVYRKENETRYLGNPQVFMIVSSRGVEFGFSPLTHPDDFSNSDIKRQTRSIASAILQQMPVPESSQAEELRNQMAKAGDWNFRRKQRLDPNHNEFDSLNEWLRFVRSEEGSQNAGGGLTRYFLPEEVDDADLDMEVRQMAIAFRPLMEHVLAAPSDQQPPPTQESPTVTNLDPDANGFSEAFLTFSREFSKARAGTFQKVDNLWAAMSAVKTCIAEFTAVQKRPYIEVNMSVGQGNWANVPWIALLNSNITKSTQEGIYIVFLISKDLSRVYLTLNQGTTNLVRELGQTDAQARMIAVANEARKRIAYLTDNGYVLDNAIKLGAGGWLAKNYEIGTIAHIDFSADHIPNDGRMNELLEAALAAYDRIIEAPERPAPSGDKDEIGLPDDLDPELPEPYEMDEALSELFLSKSSVEQFLTIWKTKKNLILQGAPGVGKSFVAKRLAYLLLGTKDRERIETIQFHQSYSYEDFIQGYRPDGVGGFTLRNGVFHRFCEKAILSPERNHVFIIDEINRGNLSKILGELMLLIEHDKRGPGWATTLTYAKAGEPRFFVPDNLFILGMMNTADRSLSIVDYALRRRFSFATLEPMFGSASFRRLLLERGIPELTVTQIVSRMIALNQEIGDDRANLGPGYRIGHSFFVPPEDFRYDPDWYRRVIDTEIYPLLEEYWFDAPDKASGWYEELLRDTP